MAEVSLTEIEAAFDKIQAAVEIWRAGVAVLSLADPPVTFQFEDGILPALPAPGADWPFLVVPEGGGCGFDIDVFCQKLTAFLTAYHHALMGLPGGSNA